MADLKVVQMVASLVWLRVVVKAVKMVAMLVALSAYVTAGQ